MGDFLKERKMQEQRALLWAENHGVYEYQLYGDWICYWSYYGSEGMFHKQVNLATGESTCTAYPEWTNKDTIPEFLRTPYGACLYNYFEG